MNRVLLVTGEVGEHGGHVSMLIKIKIGERNANNGEDDNRQRRRQLILMLKSVGNEIA